MTGDWIGTFIGHKGAVWSAHINSTATHVVTGSADYTVKLWDSLTGDELHCFTHSRIVKTVQFAKDDKRILTGGQDKILRVFDLSSKETLVSLEGHTQPIKAALWVDENTILSAAQEQIKVWDLRSGTNVQTHNTKSAVTGMELSLFPDHITITNGKEVLLWNTKFEPVKSLAMPVEVNSASLSPDGTTLVVGGQDFWSRVYELVSGRELEVLKGHHGPVHCIRFAPDGQTFASGSEDGTIRLWQSGQEPKTYGLWQENSLKDKDAVTPNKDSADKTPQS